MRERKVKGTGGKERGREDERARAVTMMFQKQECSDTVRKGGRNSKDRTLIYSWGVAGVAEGGCSASLSVSLPLGPLPSRNH